FDRKYAGQNRHLALQFDNVEMDDLSGILPCITEPQQRVLHVAICRWRRECQQPREVQVLVELITRRIDVQRYDRALDMPDEDREFGVNFEIITQRPSKLDPDVTSQCKTLITMRIKNPDDQRFIVRSSDMLSQDDIDELPALSTGEALISGRSIPAPLLVKI